MKSSTDNKVTIYQYVSALIDGDGVSFCALLLDQILRDMNYNCTLCSSFSGFDISDNDILMYHFCGANPILMDIQRKKCKKILVFHNVATSSFFRNIDWNFYSNLAVGHQEILETTRCFDYAIVLSEYSKRTLEEAGWRSDKISVIPLVEFKPEWCSPNASIINRYSNDFKNFLFVGRVSPNKKIEDVICAFDYYQKHIDKNIRLFLVGNIQFHNYYKALQMLVETLGTENVVFTNKVSQEALEAYYQIADIFMCMSEHEGFCLPIMEAFAHSVPVIAYAATAVPDTMGGAGILIKEKKPELIANYIKRIINDDVYREEIIEVQRNRIQHFNIYEYETEIKKVIDMVNNIPLKEQNNIWDKCIALHKNYIKIPEQLETGRFAIYGYGKAGKKLLNMLSPQILKKQLVVICDNNSKEKAFHGVPIVTVKELHENYLDLSIVITVQQNSLSIVEELLNYGFSINQIWQYISPLNIIKQ